MKVELPNGDWAELREPGELRQGDRKAVLRAMVLEVDAANNKGYVPGGQDDDMREALLKRILTNWSLPYMLPKDDPGSFDLLTLDQADALAVAVKPHLDLIMGKNDPRAQNTVPTTDSVS